MSTYETYLLVAVGLLLLSLLLGFSAVTNRRSVAVALVLFIMGGFALYYATRLDASGNLATDIPTAFYKLFAQVF